MNDYWNDPPDDLDPPECCGEYMDVCEGTGIATCATCGRRIEPEPDIEPVLDELPGTQCTPEPFMSHFPTTSPLPPFSPSGVEGYLCTLLADLDGFANGKAMLAAHQLEREAADNVVVRMRADIASRQEYGRSKYPQDLIDNPAQFAPRLQHAYEEALDLCVYLTWALIYCGPFKLLEPLQGHLERMQIRSMHFAVDCRIILDLFSAPNPTEPTPPR
jgi:hypothetical protein